MAPKFQVPGYNVPLKDWKTVLVEEIGAGKVLPIIGNVLFNDLAFGGHKELMRQLVDGMAWPLEDKRDELVRRFEYVYVTSCSHAADKLDMYKSYLQFFENKLAEIAPADRRSALVKEAKYGSMSLSEKAAYLECLIYDLANPLVRLANLPLPIYVTTSCHDFLESALRKEGKQPRWEFCRWNEQLRSMPRLIDFVDGDYEPSERFPLVFHLHGIDEHPESLVLTEDDHFDFLATVVRDKDMLIPRRIREALANWSLLVVGYDLRAWDFKVVYRSMIKPRGTVLQKKSASIQLSPEDLAEKEYLEAYLRLDTAFEVLWGDARDVLADLWQAWVDAETLARDTTGETTGGEGGE